MVVQVVRDKRGSREYTDRYWYRDRDLKSERESEPFGGFVPWESNPRRFHDVFFLPVAAACISGFAILSYISLAKVHRLDNLSHNDLLIYAYLRQLVGEIQTVDIVLYCLFLSVSSLVLGFVLILGLLFLYRAFLIGILFFNTFVGILGMIYCVNTQHWSVAILITGFVFVIWVIGWRLQKRLAFSNVLIKLGAKLMMRNSQVWITYWLMLLTNSIMVLLYLVTALASIITFMDEPDQKIRYTVFGFLLFTGYYFAQLFRNAAQLVIGIIFSKWYFRSKVSYWTASFHIFFKGLGSVCVGSLFSSLLSLFKLVLLFFQQSKLHKQYLSLKPLLWCITSIVHILDETSRYFNEYAFAYMSIHGDGYFTSSSGVFSLHSSRGYDAFLIGSVIKLVLRLYIVSAGFLGTVASYYYLCYFYGYYLHSGTNIRLFYILSVTSGVILMQISRILAMIVNSYVHVLFICVVEYRQLLETCHPREYAALKATRLWET